MLDSFYFVNNPSSQINCGGNTFCICVDENNVKHILVCRGRYATPKELDNKLSLTTIINFYLAFVANVVYPTKILRDLKEINMSINNFKFPRNVLIKRGDKTNVYVVNGLNYDKNRRILTYRCKNISFGIDGTLFSDNLDSVKTYQLTNINEIVNFLDIKNSITDTELNDFIIQNCEKKIQSINNMMTNVLSKLNNF